MVVFMKEYLVYQLKHFIIILIFMLSWSIQSAKVIFDLGNVLIDPHSTAAFKMLGIKNVVRYMFSMHYFNPKTMKKMLNHKLYEILNKEEIVDQLITTSTNKHEIKDQNGSILPIVMCTWLEGTIPCETIKIIVSHTIDMHPEWFSCPAEQHMIKSLTHLLFTPEKLCHIMKFNANAIKFVKECKSKGHQVYVLSNWDKESFSLLQQKYPHIFALFDGIVISGEHCCAKPNKKIYQNLIKQYNLNPKECLFIDDQLENLAVARTFGITTIHCKKNKKLFGSKQNLVKIHHYLLNR